MTCITISFMEINHQLHRCHWGSFECFVFSYMFCQNAFLPFVFRKNNMKSVLMKLSYLMIVCWKTKHAYLFHLCRPITTCITNVIGDHLYVLCTRTCSVAFRFWEKLNQISANETTLLNDCVWGDKTYIPFSIIDKNQD